jgi:hypothetical protein
MGRATAAVLTVRRTLMAGRNWRTGNLLQQIVRQYVFASSTMHIVQN